MSLSGPATAWAWTQSNVSGEPEICICPIQPDRAWEEKNGRERPNADEQSLVHQTNETWGCKGASAKHLVKGMNTYLRGVFLF